MKYSIKLSFSVILGILIIVFYFSCCISEEKTVVITIENAIEIALENNRELIEAKQNLPASLNRLRKAKSAKGFTLKLQGQYSITEEGINFTSIDPTPNFVMLTDGNQNPVNLINIQTNQPLTLINPQTGQPFLNPQTGQPFTNLITAPAWPPKTITASFADKEQKNLVLNISQPLYTFGKISGGVKISQLGYESDILNVEKIKQKVILEVKKAYYYRLLAEEGVKVSEEALKQAEAHLKASKDKFESGASPKFDVIRAEVEVASAKEKLITAKKGLELAKKALNNVIGMPLNKEYEVMFSKSPDIIQDLSLEKCLNTAIEKRIELKQIELGIKQATIGAKIASLRPSFVFQANYGLVGTGSMFAKENVWTAMIMGEIPIYDNGSAHFQVAEAKANVEKLKTTREKALEGIKLQVENEFLSLKEAEERVKTSTAIEKMAKEAVRMAELGYKEGVTSNIDLIDAQTSLTGAEMNKAKAIFDFEIAKANLANAIGIYDFAELK